MDIRYVSLGRYNGERLMTLAVSKNKLRAELAARQKRKNGTENMRSNFITMFQYEYKLYLHNIVTLLQENFEWVDTRRATWILSNGGNEDARKNIKSKLYRAKRNPERSGFIEGKHWKKVMYFNTTRYFEINRCKATVMKQGYMLVNSA